MRDGRTLSRVRRERRCSHELVVVVSAVQQVEAAVLAAAEQRNIPHRRQQGHLIEPTPTRGVRARQPLALARRRARRSPRCSPHTTRRRAIRPSTRTRNTRLFTPPCPPTQASRHSMPTTSTPSLRSSPPRLPRRRQSACIQQKARYPSSSLSLPSITRSACGYTAPALNSRWASSTTLPIPNLTALSPILSSTAILTLRASSLRPLQTERPQKTPLPPHPRNG